MTGGPPASLRLSFAEQAGEEAFFNRRAAAEACRNQSPPAAARASPKPAVINRRVGPSRACAFNRRPRRRSLPFSIAWPPVRRQREGCRFQSPPMRLPCASGLTNYALYHLHRR